MRTYDVDAEVGESKYNEIFGQSYEEVANEMGLELGGGPGCELVQVDPQNCQPGGSDDDDDEDEVARWAYSDEDEIDGRTYLIRMIDKRDEEIRKLYDQLEHVKRKLRRWKNATQDLREEKDQREAEEDERRWRSGRYLRIYGEHQLALRRNCGHAATRTLAQILTEFLSHPETNQLLDKNAITRCERRLDAVIRVRDLEWCSEALDEVEKYAQEVCAESSKDVPMLIWCLTRHKMDTTNSELVHGEKAQVVKSFMRTCRGKSRKIQADMCQIRGSKWEDAYLSLKQQVMQCGFLGWDEAVSSRCSLPDCLPETMQSLHCTFICSDAAGDVTACSKLVVQEAAQENPVSASDVGLALPEELGSSSPSSSSAESRTRARESAPQGARNGRTCAFLECCKKHQNQLSQKKQNVTATGKAHTNSFIRVCNVNRSKGGTRRVRDAVSKLPSEGPKAVTPEEREKLMKILSKAIVKPMRGRWGSFHPARQRLVDVVQATSHKKVLADLFRMAFHKMLSDAQEYAEEDAIAQQQPIQEEEDYSRILRTKARNAVYDLESDEFYAKLIISQRCCDELEHQLNWMLKQKEDDGSSVNHVIKLASGHSRGHVEAMLRMLDFRLPEWRVLDDFIGGPVSLEDAHTSILKHIMIGTSEQHRRFVLHYEDWPFPLVEILNAPEDWSAPSPRRADICKKALDCCRVCLGPGTAALVDALTPFFELCAASGGVLVEEVGDFFQWFFRVPIRDGRRGGG